MSNFKSMVFKLDPEQREEQGKLVERYLTALGYKDMVEWNAVHRTVEKCIYIHTEIDGTYSYYSHLAGVGVDTPIPIAYQVAVAEHMATAPQELAEYVRGRLVSSDSWIEGYKPIQCCGFDWHGSVERYSFWIRVDMKNWPKAMATDFWKKHTAPSEATSEMPKGVIGQWYTLLTNFSGAMLTHDRQVGYTWQCQEVSADEPMIDGVAMSENESYRLATPEEIAATQAPAIEFEKPEHPEEYDYVNPKHYQEFSVEVIDMMAAIWGEETAALHCEMCAFKYKLRAGSKPDQPIERDLDKAAWYLSKAKELRS